MKAAVWYGKRDIRIETVPHPPAPGKGEIQIEVSWSGICGTDLHEYLAGPIFIPWDNPHPLTGHQGPTILGHEMSGRVVAMGSDVTEFAIGDRVVSDIVLYCGHCKMCRQGKYVLCYSGASLGLQTATGGFGEYVNMPAYTVHKLPSEVPDDVGAMVEPLATALRAIRQGRINIGDLVAVIGGGATGMFALQASWLAGAKEVYMITSGDNRKNIACALGASNVIDSTDDPIPKILSMTEGRGVDVVIDTGGSESSLHTACKITAKCGRIVLVGIFANSVSFDANELVFFEKEIVGSLGRDGLKDVKTAIKYLQKGWIKAGPLMTQKIGLDEIVSSGFEELAKKEGYHIKILVSPKGV